MSTDDVKEMLKEIGPHVLHATSEVAGKTFHMFTVGSAPAGKDAYRACLCIPSVVRLEEVDWDTMIAEGKNRYEGRT